MLTETVVINASPFILLSKCGLIELLPRLFPKILMPKSVSEEISRGSDIASERMRKFEKTWLDRVPVSIAKEVEFWNLGDGETEVLSLVLENKINHLALVDDRAARRCAETLGIKTLGTAGLLIVAKKRNLILRVKPDLEKLESAGLYFSRELRLAIYEQAGEIE